MKKLSSILLLLSTFVFIQNAKSTNVSGGIYANTTWTFANSPYIVTDTVVVFPGITLTIEAGVVVKFTDHTYLEIRQANIVASGTSSDSIIFTSNSTSPANGIWGGIYLNGYTANTTATFNYCSIQFATVAINNYSQQTMYLKNSNLINNHTGLTSNGTYNFVDSCNFDHNITSGINGNIIGDVNYCSMSYNGIGVDNTRGNYSHCSINNNQTGFSENNASWISDCYINFNQTGFSRIEMSSIKNCTIDYNSIQGIWVGFEGDSLTNCEIKYNGIGVYDQSSSSTQTVITQCVIENNTTGIKLTSNHPIIYCNQICSNSSYDLYYNATTNNYNISNNYWCTTDDSTISAHIFDGYDDISLGLVTFTPVDTVPCFSSAGINTLPANEMYLSIYPIPTTTFLNIATHLPNNSQFLIKDIMGRTVYPLTTIYSSQTTINISTLNNGIYFLKVMSDDKTINRKIVVNK